jgi:hypothetical protein
VQPSTDFPALEEATERVHKATGNLAAAVRNSALRRAARNGVDGAEHRADEARSGTDVDRETEMMRAYLASLDALLSSAVTTPEARHRHRQAVRSLQPVHGRRGQADGTSEVWGDALEEQPLWAIEQAVKWSVQQKEKLPSISSFLGHVRCVIGDEAQSGGSCCARCSDHCAKSYRNSGTFYSGVLL